MLGQIESLAKGYRRLAVLLIAAAFQIDLEIGRRGYEAALYGKPAKNANRLRLHLVDTVSLGPDIGEVADPVKRGSPTKRSKKSSTWS